MNVGALPAREGAEVGEQGDRRVGEVEEGVSALALHRRQEAEDDDHFVEHPEQQVRDEELLARPRRRQPAPEEQQVDDVDRGRDERQQLDRRGRAREAQQLRPAREEEHGAVEQDARLERGPEDPRGRELLVSLHVYHPRMCANMRGATIVASLSTM